MRDMCASCRILYDPVVFDTCYLLLMDVFPSTLCGCACRRVYVHGSLTIGLVRAPM